MAEYAYKEYQYSFVSKGLAARFSLDRTPEDMYWNLLGFEVRQENALSSRLGRLLLTADNNGNPLPLADTNIHTLSRLKGTQGNTFRYAGANTSLYRRTGDANGSYGIVATGLSGNRFSSATYRPNFSSFPFIFFADSVKMLKDNGTFNSLEQMGIFAPLASPIGTVPTANQLVSSLVVELFSANVGFAFTNCSFNSIIQNVNTSTTLTSPVFPGYSLAILNAAISAYAALVIDNGTANQETVFNVPSASGAELLAVFSNPHNGGASLIGYEMLVNLTATEPAIISKSVKLNLNLTGTVADASDFISLFVYAGTANVVGGTVEIDFDVSDGTFTNYYKGTASIPALGSLPVKIQRSAFTTVGTAGNPGNTWANVAAFRIQVTPPGGVTSGTFGLSGLAISGLGGPDATTGGAVPYDYRITYFNNNTGDESNPSVPWIQPSFLSPANQPVSLKWFLAAGTVDPQVTHVRIYRRGGILTTGWFFVAQVPIFNGTGGYVDALPDFAIQANFLLAIDNDVPVTSTLPVPVNTTLNTPVSGSGFPGSFTITPASMANIFPNQTLTIDTGVQQEQVIVISTTGTTFTAVFQTSHQPNALVTASTKPGVGVNLMIIAFNQAWFAGDPNNPNRLYYSKVNNPEAVPPQNWIEIGTPADPIMNIAFYRGQIFVFTQSRPWTVIVPFPGAVPVPFPTSSRHGLYASFGLAFGEGVLPYLSKDGLYVFGGGDSVYASYSLEWLFADKEPNLGPVPEQDPAQAANTIMAFHKNEFFVSYTDKTAIQRRVAYDLVKQRFRNDDVAATAMFYEEDTEELIIGKTNGLIYRDRRGNVDQEGTGITSNLALALLTDAKDQGAPLHPKIYNELSLDLDTGGETLTVKLIFDNGTTTVNMGTVQTTGRQRVPFPINSGNGQISQNVQLSIVGSIPATDTNAVVHLYNWYIKAAIEAELRETFDTYYVKFGSDEFKICKQGWFEYVAADPAGISFSVYLEGSSTPAFTFNLPQSTIRRTEKVRFPAFKATLWRFTANSPSPFSLYGESFIEYKIITQNKGYAREKLGNITAQGSV